MYGEEFKFLPDEYKISIIQALTDAIRKDIYDFIEEFDLETSNGIHFLKWDFINSNLIRNAADGRLHCIKIKRGRWELVLLYDTELKYLYTLMKHKRFIQLQDQKKKRAKAHYIDALALLNKGLHSPNDQLSLFENSSWDEGAENLLYNLVREHQDNIERFVLIGFSTLKDDITSVSAILPSVELGIAHEVDWSEFISTDYSTSNVTFNYTPSDEEEEEVPVKLKKQTGATRDNVDDDLPVNIKKDDDNKKTEES
ncbi:MAG: phiCD27 1 [Bacilli bacterium]|nr:phiCD27 1 [Bacilli bacterium]